MKRLFVTLAIVLLGWFFYLQKKNEPHNLSVSDQLPQPRKSIPSKLISHVTTKEPAQLVAKSAVQNSEVPEAPPKDTASYVTYGQLVVSYGDVLIGKPTTNDFPQRGYVNIPKLSKWTSKEIAFAIHQDLPNPERVFRVIEYFNNNTPVRFVHLKNQNESIVFAPSEVPLCLSYVGRIGGHQPIFLDDRCGEREITHEVMHALGFIHEHSRPDRDQFVRVNWQNIEPDKQEQFEVVPDFLFEIFKDRPFNYESVMIYNDTDFGRIRGDITMDSRTSQKISPTENGLSAEDLHRLEILFRDL